MGEMEKDGNRQFFVSPALSGTIAKSSFLGGVKASLLAAGRNDGFVFWLRQKQTWVDSPIYPLTPTTQTPPNREKDI